MAQPITDPLANQCGNCQFWDSAGQPEGRGECCGTPPTPILVGMRERKFGPGVDMQMELLRPIMAYNARPCALHKRLLTVDLGILAKGN